jgi:ABC-type oligopeptide transport system ATPase subunit
MTRTFEDKVAVRERVPLLVGLVGPSGGGKTYSALRLATGFQRVTGGDIHFIDTEARRGLHYADRFKFRHVVFGAPFGSLDYLAAIDYCVSKGAKTIIVDSMSHEHEGPGGLLEVHTAETTRLAKAWGVKESVAQLSAWAKPKADRRRMINSVLQYPCNFIFCFRAKDKLKIKKGEDPQQMGFMPIAGEEFVFEMMINALLLPGARGVPAWSNLEMGERRMCKLPEQFRDYLLGEAQADHPLTEDAGEVIAKWSEGTAVGGGLFSEIKTAIAMAGDLESLKLVAPRLKKAREEKAVPPNQYTALVEAMAARKKELEVAAETAAASANPSEPEDDAGGEPPADYKSPTAPAEADDSAA